MNDDSADSVLLNAPSFAAHFASLVANRLSRFRSSRSSGEVYRINLEEGRFSEPISSSPTSTSLSGTTCIAASPMHRILSVGSEDGKLHFYDTRISSSSTMSPFATLDVSGSTSGYGFSTSPNPTVTSVAYEDSGVTLAAGTGEGCVALYDVRSSKPVHVKEHNHGLPIHTCAFHHAR